MQSLFTESGNWILPVQGTLGNKARDLYANTQIVLANGAKIPKSLVVPFEYLKNARDPKAYTLELIDKYFPDWLRILVRSNAPDEDVGLRFPGLYTSEHLWHTNRSYAPTLIDRVIASYNHDAAKTRRSQLGLPELGMCLLIMEPVTNTPGEFDANYAGCFSDIGELAVLAFNNPKRGLEAMISKPIKRLRIDKEGVPIDSFTPQEQDLAYRLRKLTDELPKIEGKGWGIEFVVNNDGLYVVQTTPVIKSGRIEIPQGISNIFDVTDVVGAGEFATDGILYAPVHPDKNALVRFDRAHVNYCLAVYPSNISTYNHDNVLKYAVNPAVVLSLDYEYDRLHSFPEHIRQYMREGRIALAGTFKNPNFGNIHFGRNTRFIGSARNEQITKLVYSPTKLFIVGDEVTQKGLVGLSDETIHDFTSVK